jgi:hypothetical protein
MQSNFRSGTYLRDVLSKKSNFKLTVCFFVLSKNKKVFCKIPLFLANVNLN